MRQYKFNNHVYCHMQAMSIISQQYTVLRRVKKQQWYETDQHPMEQQ